MSTSIKIKLFITGSMLTLAVSLILSGSTTPNHKNLYGLKRFQEKLFMTVKSKPEDRVNFYLILLDERLSELKFLVENRYFDYILTSSLRYSTTAGLLTRVIIDHQLSDLAPVIQQKFEEHQRIIKILDDSYPKDENEEWKFVQDDFNYLAIYSRQLTDAIGNEKSTE